MAIFNWAANVSGDWNTGTLWTSGSVPNAATADVTIDAAATLVPYTVTIAAGETETVGSLTMNATNNFSGTYKAPYTAAELELDGTLAFAAGSAGAFNGSLQTFVHEGTGASAAILNGGTLNAFIQAQGTLLLAGTNTLSISNELAALGGTVTVAAPLGNITASTLTDGIFNATGPAAVINLGCAGQIVSIATVAAETFGFTELTLSGPASAINEWNGSRLVAIETTLREIGAGGTVSILGGRNYTSNASLTVDETIGESFFGAAMLNLQAGTVAIAGGIDINGGIVQGYGTIAASILNNGTLIALGGTIAGTLDVTGSLAGTGAVAFDLNASTGGDPTEATLLLNSVASGQTITMNNGGDTLILATPAAFAGTIAAGSGGRIILQGLTAASALLNQGTLLVRNAASQTVASLALTGSYAGDSVVTSGSVVTILATPTISGTKAGQAITDHTTITPFSAVAIADPNAAQTETVTVTLSAALNGTLTNLGAAGTYNAATGVYTITGTPSAVTAALSALVFIPTQAQVLPGQTVTTHFTISDTDSASKTATDSTTTVITTAGTALPTITGISANLTITDQQAIAPFAQVTISDANYGQTENVSVFLSNKNDGTLSNPSGRGSYAATDGIYNVSGSAAAVTAALRGLVFIPTPHEVTPGQTVTTTFAIQDRDTASQLTVNRNTTVNTTDIAVPPTITGAAAGQAIFDQATVAPFAGVTIADANVGQLETVTVTQLQPANGTLSNTAAWTCNATTDAYTTSGIASVVTAALKALVFTPTLHQATPGQSVTTNFTISDSDTASQAATNSTTTVITTAGTVLPTISAGGGTSAITDLGSIAPFAGVVIADANHGQTETLTVSFPGANGAFTNLGGVFTVPAPGVYTVVGSASQVTAALDALIFDPTAHQLAPGGTVVTTFTIRDTDTASASAINTTRTIDAIASASQPMITGAVAAQTVLNQGTIAPFTQVTIGDVNLGQTETVTVALLTPNSGTLTNLGGGNYNPSTGVYTVTGTQTAVTSALRGLIFSPAPLQGALTAVTTRFVIADSDTAGQAADPNTTTTVTDTLPIVAPTITGTATGQQVSDQGTIAPFAHVTISDANAGQTETVTVSLAAANGTLTDAVSGTYIAQTGTYSVTGSPAAVTTALRALLFTPTAHQVAPGGTVATTFTITDTDTALQAATSAATTVIATAVAVAPTITGTLPNQTLSDQATITPFPNVSVNDANVGQTETVTVTLSPAAYGTLSSTGLGTYNTQTGTYSVTGTAAAVTAVLRALVFTPAAHQVAPGQTVPTTVTISDTDSARATAATATTTLIATAGTVAPTINGTAAGQAVSDQGTITPFANVTITDLNFGQVETVTVDVLQPLNGALTNLGTGTYSSQTGIYSITGSAAAVTTSLQGLIFTPTAQQVPPGQTVTTNFTITDTDVAGAAATDLTTTVIATAGTVAPTISGTGSTLTISDQGTIAPFPSAAVTDLNLSQTETVTVGIEAANGTLSDAAGGSYNPQTGVFSVTGTQSAVTAALDALLFTPTLHQVPFGQSAPTVFTITDTDSAGATVIDRTTTVVANATPVAPTISGSAADQPISDQGMITPFANVTIADTNPNPTDTLTVTLSAAGNGALSNLSGGSYNKQTGIYYITGPPDVVTAALQALVFTPTAQQVPPGQTVTTGFTITDTDAITGTDTAPPAATDVTTSVIATAGTVAPTISGTAPGQAVSDLGTITPFANVTIADLNLYQAETVTVTLSAAANGTLTNLGGGSYDPQAGVCSLIGPADAVTAALQSLVFTPTARQVAPGQTVTTNFTITDTDTALQTATDSTSSVIATAGTVAPTISGTMSRQTVSDQGTITPFANVTITDLNLGQTETATVTLSAPANGTLTHLGGGTYNSQTGIYSVTGSLASITAALNALVFVPTQAEVPGGQTITTGFSLSVTDTAGASATDTATTAVTTAVTAPAGEVILSGSSSQYIIADDNGSLYVQDTVAGRNRTQTLPGITVMKFTDGVALFDPTGTAENVARLYQAALARPPDLAGLESWTRAIDDSNVPLSAVSTNFTTSPEFIADYGSLSNAAYVQRLYLNVLGRPPDAAGLQSWEAAMASGESRGNLLLNFAESSEFEADTLNLAGNQENAEIYRLYSAALKRPPDASGLASWSADLASGASLTQIAQAFVSAPEFVQDYGALSAGDFINVMYNNVLHRAADPAGLRSWTNEMLQGASRAAILLDFSDCLENRGLTAGATHANWVFNLL